eukprot:6059347-Pyramimonas_sp.AAC.1
MPDRDIRTLPLICLIPPPLELLDHEGAGSRSPGAGRRPPRFGRARPGAAAGWYYAALNNVARLAAIAHACTAPSAAQMPLMALWRTTAHWLRRPGECSCPRAWPHQEVAMPPSRSANGARAKPDS